MNLRTLSSLPIAILALTGIALMLMQAAFVVPGNADAGGVDRSWVSAVSILAFALWAALLFLLVRRETGTLHALLIGLPDVLRARIFDDKPVRLEGASRPDEIGALIRRLEDLADRTHKAVSAKHELEQMAQTDPLTGLPNRRGLFAFINKVVGHDRGWTDPGKIGVLHIDLDHFKVVNDTLGHDAGDYVLKEASLRMADAVRDSDLIARIGGDEFVIVAPGIDDTEALESMIERLVEQFQKPIGYREELCNIGISIGAVVSGQGSAALDANGLLADADLALCNAKASGRGGFSMFSSSMRKASQNKEERAREIREGLLAGEFQAWFQPVIDMRTGQVTGVELLSRWHRPEHGVVLPSDFLAAAELHSMLDEIGLQVLENACRAIREWRGAGHRIPVMHVNMTRAQLLAPAAVDKLTWVLDDANIRPHDVAIELSERSCGGRSAEVIFENLRRFQALGLRSVLDDFGADSAAIRNISRLGCYKVKCARTLVHALTEDSDRLEDLEILRGLPGIALHLGVDVIAKGVESQAQIDALGEVGFAEIQGDIVAPAMDADTFIDWYAARKDTLARSA